MQLKQRSTDLYAIEKCSVVFFGKHHWKYQRVESTMFLCFFETVFHSTLFWRVRQPKWNVKVFSKIKDKYVCSEDTMQ